MKSLNIWNISSFIISFLVIIPLITVFSSFFQEISEYSELLKRTFLYEYIFNSITLLLGVLSVTLVIGVGCAYIVSFYNFPFVNFFKWALILGFAVPPYIYAYSLTAFFENYGTAFTILKSIFGEGEYNSIIPKFSGMLGAILSISFSIYSYVYILTRASFYFQSQNLIDLGKNLGFSKSRSFFKIIFPSARPAIVAGLALVAMETLSDFGAVDFFSINTLTTAIYNSWISFDDLAFSNQLSFYLLIFIFILFILEKLSRKNAKYHLQMQGGFKKIEKINLKGLNAFLAFLMCFTIFFLSFIFPVGQMLYWTLLYPKNFFDLNIFSLAINTLLLVSLSSVILVFFSFISNYGNRISRSKFLDFLTTISISGYALPGVILAVAYITFIAWFDNIISFFLDLPSFKNLFIGSILGLIVAYFVRFYSLSCNGLKSGYEKLHKSVDETAYLAGYSKSKTFFKIHIPYMKSSILFIVILISLEIIRELPITLILRPFNFETFATTAYIYASQDLLEAAAVPSLCLVLIASLFIFIISSYILKEHND